MAIHLTKIFWIHNLDIWLCCLNSQLESLWSIPVCCKTCSRTAPSSRAALQPWPPIGVTAWAASPIRIKPGPWSVVHLTLDIHIKWDWHHDTQWFVWRRQGNEKISFAQNLTDLPICTRVLALLKLLQTWCYALRLYHNEVSKKCCLP